MPKVKPKSPPHRLSSLAHQRPPSPNVVVALALIPCPSASALACRHCHCCRHRQRWMCPANCRHPPLPLPREISLSRRTPFTIAVVNAAATATVANDNDDDDDNDGDRIPLPRSKLHHRPPLPSTTMVRRCHSHCLHQAIFAASAANLIVVNLLPAAVCHYCRHFLYAADTLVISCNLVDC